MRFSQKIFWIGAFTFSIGTSPALDVHQSEYFFTKVMSCQKSCHLPNNIKKIQLNKQQNKKCQACHSDEKAVKTISPFNSYPPSIFMKTFPEFSPNRIVDFHLTQFKNSPALRSSNTQSRKLAIPKNMAYIPSGEFIMGSNDRWDDESPEFLTSTGEYFIDLYEVTNKDYQIYITKSGVKAPFHWHNGKAPKNKLDHPVIYVNWFEARSFCRWTGKRLPTEKEWEKAARGVKGNIYPWGNIWDLNKSNNPYAYSTGTKAVGSYPKGKSPYGLFDMSGNVWEWVDSHYLPHPGNTVSRPEYGKKNRVLKGGSWFDCLSYGCGLSAPTFNRSFFTPEIRNNSFGFRCAKTLEKSISVENDN